MVTSHLYAIWSERVGYFQILSSSRSRADVTTAKTSHYVTNLTNILILAGRIKIHGKWCLISLADYVIEDGGNWIHNNWYRELCDRPNYILPSFKEIKQINKERKLKLLFELVKVFASALSNAF